ncbi:hypothetical protein LCGC14_0501160 [marine sediment metagenome]|uniref:Uncharacterized protein n=1 Tax=marine sediment metagenome TaxID=412755 RepID=A0A0F9UQU0_9ZZZZ
MKVKLTTPVANFIITYGITIKKAKGDTFHFIPFWFKETAHPNILEEFGLDNVPEELRSAIEEDRNPSVKIHDLPQSTGSAKNFIMAEPDTPIEKIMMLDLMNQTHAIFMAINTYFELETCNWIWPDSETDNSNHFFDKWLKDDKQPLLFWNRLDPENKAKLLNWYSNLVGETAKGFNYRNENMVSLGDIGTYLKNVKK